MLFLPFMVKKTGSNKGKQQAVLRKNALQDIARGCYLIFALTKPTAISDFFVSYNRADKAWAEWIAWTLEDVGYSVVIDLWDFRAGGNFVLAMDQATKKCRQTIAVLSPNYLDAEYPQPEWAAAFASDPAGKKRALIPVRVEQSGLEGLMAQIVHVDLVGLTEPRAREELLKGVSNAPRIKPPAQPAFPLDKDLQKPEFPAEKPRLKPTTLPGPPQEPYPFLGPYTRPDTYAGRDYELEKVKLALRPPIQILLFYGTSGDGKSSLLTAGLRPALRREGRPVAYLTDPYREGLAERLVHQLLIGVTEAPADRDAAAWVGCLRMARELSGKAPVLILDQFEEVMTIQDQGAPERVFALIQAAIDASSDEEPLCQWVLSYRREYHGWVDPWLSNRLGERGGLVRSLELPRFGDQYGEMDSRQAAQTAFLQAIEKPLNAPDAAYSIAFAPGAAKRLAEAFARQRSFRGSRGAPLLPELQVVLQELLTKKGWPLQKKLTLEVPEDLTSLIDRALERHLLRALEELCPEGVAGASKKRERVLIALYRLTESDGERVRRHPGRSKQDLENWLGEDGESLLRKLDRNLRLVSSEARGDEVVYRLAHDRLAEVVADEVKKDPSLSPDRHLLPLERIVANKSRQFAEAVHETERRDSTRLEPDHFKGIEESAEVLLYERRRLDWWSACGERKRAEEAASRKRQLWLLLAAAVVVLAVLGLAAKLYFNERLAQIARLENQVVQGTPGEALLGLAALYGDYGQTSGEILKRRESAHIVFESGPADLTDLKDPERAKIVWLAVEGAMDFLVKRFSEDRDKAKPSEILPRQAEMGSALWALDRFSLSQAAERTRAARVRKRLVEAMTTQAGHPNFQIDWIQIEGGQFTMGTTTDQWAKLPKERRRPDEAPHEVKLSTFQLSRHEVTNRQFSQLFPHGGIEENLEYPAAAMNWYQAYVFAAWVGGDQAGRLPTEAEWEYAARSRGQQRIWPWGDGTLQAPEICGYAVVQDCSGPHPVCKTDRGNTDQEICDMAGNVWEWVADWYEQDYPKESVTDPLGPGSAPGGDRVIRGGSFDDPADWARASTRDRDVPWIWYQDLGFRVVLPAVPQP